MYYKTQSITKLVDTLVIMRVIAGIILLALFSWEIINGSGGRFSALYINVQFAICMLFVADFFTLLFFSRNKLRYIKYRIAFLLISIPYIAIFDWLNLSPSHFWTGIIGLMPMLRALMSFVIVVKWIVRNRIEQLLFVYIFISLIFNYFAALIFYEYELRLNSELHGFFDAIWWAWMNFTSAGASIIPVTTIGKALSMALPTLGMLMFPILTTYILERYNGWFSSKKGDK